ncbi:glycolipid transfer protein-like [Aricia agestis]|uniref:glycolipid transfer protein-like n=1 Tax=Aricia agestis TaxID=91739 RepID=UPI001C2030D2|nr:glycolipid transfer protein-like [Aricia agestis]
MRPRKIKKFYTYNEDTCLLALMLDEKSRGRDEGAEGVLWLNRSLLFFELVFEEIIKSLQRKEIDASIKTILTTAYNGSVKKYHNWVTQKIFYLILNISPSLPQMLKLLDPSQNMEEFEKRLIELHYCLKIIRCRIDTFFQENNMFVENK